jgi:PAS domain S-box-containing protein
MRPQDLGLGKLFETVRDATIVADARTGRIVLWNPATTEIFGRTPSVVTLRPPWATPPKGRAC